MKKKILLILACIIAVIMFCASTLTCFAVEVSETAVAEPAQHTVFSRVWEYCIANKTEILGLTGDAVIFILAIFVLWMRRRGFCWE